MAANKYVALVAGKLKEVFGTVTSAGVADANKIPALDSTGKLDSSLLPTGVGSETISAIASETLAAGDFVNVYNNAGALNVRKADATTNGKPANGFVLAGFASSASATIYLISQTNNQRSTLTVGAEYFLHTTPGAITTTAPSAAGNIVQRIGFAFNATTIIFDNATFIEVS